MLRIKSNPAYIYYLWLLIPLCPLMLYLSTNLAVLRSTPAQYLVNIFFVFYLIYCYKNKISLPEPSKISFIILAAAFLFIYILSEVNAYYTFHLSSYEFSIFMSMLENMDIGRIGFSQTVNMYHFGIHANWILFLIYPIYKIFPSYLTLIVIHAIAIWIPGVLLYLYARRNIGLSKVEGFIISMVYWSGYHTLKLLDHHFFPEFLFITAFLCLLFARDSKNNYAIILATLFFCMIKEDFIFYLLPWSIYNIFWKKLKIFWLVLLIGVIVFLFDKMLAQPYFLSKTELTIQGYYGFWNTWGNSPKEIILSLVSQPIEVIKHIGESYGWKRILGALIFVPLLSIDMVLFYLPALMLYSLANHGTGLNTLENSYSYLIWPAVLIAYIQIYRRVDVSLWTTKTKNTIKFILLIVLIINPLWGASGLKLYRSNSQDYCDFYTIKNMIDSKKLYCISSALLPHFDTRFYQKIYRLDDIRSHQNCFVISSIIGNTYPFLDRSKIDRLHQILASNQCIIKQQGKFLISSNSDKCYKIAVENLFTAQLPTTK